MLGYGWIKCIELIEIFLNFLFLFFFCGPSTRIYRTALKAFTRPYTKCLLETRSLIGDNNK